MAALELGQEQLAEQQEAAAAQLRAAQAAAAQSEAEKEQLQRSLGACTRELADAATLAETLHQQLQAQKQEGLAEAGALKQQLHEAQVRGGRCRPSAVGFPRACTGQWCKLCGPPHGR